MCIMGGMKRFSIGALCVWIIIIAVLACWIFTYPKEPIPMGYFGTFYVFALICSLPFVALFAVIAIVWVTVGFLSRRAGATGPRGFEVIRPKDSDSTS